MGFPDRVAHHRDMEPIAAALNLLPERLANAAQRAALLTGCDPLFAGLHRQEKIADGRSYRNTAHVALSHHMPHLSAARRRSTIVIPEGIVTVEVAVHEIAHVIHEWIGWRHIAKPVSWYAKTNRYEAFAEALTAWVLPRSANYRFAAEWLYKLDPRTVALFERLALGE